MHRMPAHSPRKLPLICALAAGCSFATAHCAAEETKPTSGSVWMAMSDNALDEMRGGFDFGSGLVLNFGIDRAVYINGALVASTSFNFNNLAGLKPEQLAVLGKYAPAAVNLIQNGPGNSVEPAPSSSGSAAVAAANNLSPAAATFIQNSLNDQQIQTLTVVNATVNTLGVLRNLNSLSTLQHALTSAIHGRF